MSFSERVLAWFDEHGRKDLPWQVPDSYRIWLSEIMLQQTQVATVIGYYDRFTKVFPTLAALAAASEDDVMAQWAGLGYYSRARNLKRAAEICVAEHNGALPDDFDALLALPGIGRSTAGAIAALAFGQHRPILDGNVKRVLARHCAVDGWPGKSAVQKRLWEIAEQRTPEHRVAAYTQAMMDLGATLCTPREPRCKTCPVSSDCAGRLAGDPSRFPGRKPRAALPERHRFALLRVWDNGVVLERRPPTGIWGGLYATPLPESLEEAGTAWPMAAPLRHTFTHFRLVMTPLLVPATTTDLKDAATRLIHQDDLDRIGLPKPMAVLLRDHFEGKLTWQEQFIA